MDILELNDKMEATPNAYCRNIVEFDKIIRRDRGSPGDSQGRKKLQATKELTYIYHMCNFQSPFATYTNEEERSEKVAKSLGLTDWKPDDLVIEAQDKYKELTESDLIKLLKSAHSTVNKMRDYFDDIDFDKFDVNGKPVYQAKDVIAAIRDLGKLVSGLRDLKVEVEREQQSSGRNRGDVVTNKYSD